MGEGVVHSRDVQVVLAVGQMVEMSTQREEHKPWVGRLELRHLQHQYQGMLVPVGLVVTVLVGLPALKEVWPVQIGEAVVVVTLGVQEIGLFHLQVKNYMQVV